MAYLKKLFNSTVLGLTLGVLLAGYAVFAFTPPAAAPPGGNVEAPLNVGDGFQEKEGDLWVRSLGINAGLVIGSVTSQPFCDDTTRGTIWNLKGAASIRDRFELCLKNADESFGWQEIGAVVPPIDFDEDGFFRFGSGGDDCNDSDASINPDSGAKCNYDPVAACAVPADDIACGTIDCDGLNFNFTDGPASATGTNFCKLKDYADLTSNRCEGYNDCKDANSSDCTSFSDVTIATCGPCQFATGACSTCSNYDAGTSCGAGSLCNGSGSCGAIPPSKECRVTAQCAGYDGANNTIERAVLQTACDDYCGVATGTVTCELEGNGPKVSSINFSSCTTGCPGVPTGVTGCVMFIPDSDEGNRFFSVECSCSAP